MQSSLGAVPKGQPQSHEHHSERPSFKYLHTPSASLSHHDFPRKAPRSQVANLFYGSCGIPSDDAGQDAGARSITRSSRSVPEMVLLPLYRGHIFINKSDRPPLYLTQA